MKKTNKGFSMVELIIVIAIMAILAGALAPTLIKYINKSRLSTDVQTGQTIATSITAALAVEQAYDDAKDATNQELSAFLASQGTNMSNEVTQALGGKVPKGKSKKDVNGSAFNHVGSFYVTLEVGSSSLKVYYSETGNSSYEVYPNPGSGMTN